MLAMVMNWIRTREEGQSLAEYALILALVAIAAIVVLGALGGSISNILNSISTSLDGAL